ncbi:MAG: Gfo/Idh/MocA family oxidoreductase [Planctomycetes bacterium]|nr:Gfo/Idh/MocA family oxidoreductase [Planctomycetota bacterium]
MTLYSRFSSRRQFLEDSMLATAATLAATSATTVSADQEPGKPVGPAEKLGVAVLGVHGQGQTHLACYVNNPATEILYICDPDQRIGEARAEAVGQKQGRRPKHVKDMRQAFDDPAVDIVSIATPNHWHCLAGIWAMLAGKDVYVEKPVSQFVREGRSLVTAARKHKRICQSGTQSRSSPAIRQAIEYLHSGKLGDVKLARGLCYNQRDSIGPRGTFEVPPHIDYDLWCGPAPDGPVTRRQFHYDWHWQWDYGNGDIGNQGIHQMDIARWGLGVDRLSRAVISCGYRYRWQDAGETPNSLVTIHDYDSRTLVFEVRNLPTAPYRGAAVGVIFECSDGFLVNPSEDSATALDKQGNVITTFKGGDRHNHQRHTDNFIDAVRSRSAEMLNADVLDGHLSSALCHLSNISYRLGELVSAEEMPQRLEPLSARENVRETLDRTAAHLRDNNVDPSNQKWQCGSWLKVDPDTESFIENPRADKLLVRNDRGGFVVPPPEQI